ncbi:MAG: NAD(P)-dependent oxidoreductase [Alphaproteobacteria bacterium]
MTTLGFLGLGKMGGPMAARLAAAGHGLVVYDKAGTSERAPAGARVAQSIAGVAAEAETVFLSLPDGAAVKDATREIIDALRRRTTTVVDLSTIGIAAAQAAAAEMAAAGLDYLDAPVSGGVTGAIKGTLAVMASGKRETFERLKPALGAMAKNLFHVGEKPGQGQAMKLLNNFLSATAMAATSEATIFGESHGLDMATMLAVLNVSTGQNTATSDKFVNRVLTGSFDAGFTTRLMAKDVGLYLENVEAAGTHAEVGRVVTGIMARLASALPDADFTRIYQFLGGTRHSR